MTPTLTLRIVTPTAITVIEGVTQLRLGAPDGSRGVLPGHEPARLVVDPEPLEVTRGHDEAQTRSFVANEGGVVWVDRDAVTVVTRWATVADDLPGLLDTVRGREAMRREVEAEARAVAHGHELATQRALAALRREVVR